jgi:glycerophosphoryl diester phosphodiesterase
MIERLQDISTIVVSGHRGLKAAYPENTLLAFQKALEAGVDMLEFDLRLTKDGHLAVIHDETVDRTTNGTGRVGDYTLSELKRLDAGGWFGKAFEGLRIPTLEELCELLSGRPDVLLNVEIKPAATAVEAADRAIGTLKRFGYLSRCVFTSFDAKVLAHIHDHHRLKTQGFPAESMHSLLSGPVETYAKMWAVALRMDQVTPERVREFRQAGLQTWCYCPDTEQDVRRALECGIYVMTCNDPFPALKARQAGSAAG